jgi:gamma-glutamylcyclotransferase (GGCT)/AIG2-like uncharacterized protein YtfP
MPSARSRARTEPPDFLFVYGTLMRGQPLHAVLARRARFVARGHVRGRLLSLGPYPGLVVGPARVRGELLRVDDPELLAAVDHEEGYNFVRRRAAVTLLDGRRVRAWIYRYCGPRDTATPIPSGDWRRRHH